VCLRVIERERLHYRADGAELRSFLQRATSGTPLPPYAALQLCSNPRI